MAAAKQNPVSVSLSVNELSSLMELDFPIFKEKLKSLGGTEGLCCALNSSSIRGLTDSSILLNRDKYGENKCSVGQSETKPSCWNLLRKSWASKDLLINRIGFYLRFIFLILIIVLGLLLAFTTTDDKFDDKTTLWHWVFSLLGLLETLVPWFLPLFILTWANGILSSNKCSFPLAEKGGSEIMGVVRNGKKVAELSSVELVVGDICRFDYSGWIVPGDGILLLGDADDGRDQRIYAGEIHFGKGILLVLAVGNNTRVAKEQAQASLSSKPSAIHENQLYLFYVFALKMALVFGALAIVTLVVLFCISRYVIDKQTWAMADGPTLITFVARGVTIFLLALPELIPPIIITSQIRNIGKCKANEILVRDFSSLSTLPVLTLLLIEESCLKRTKCDVSGIRAKAKVIVPSNGPKLGEYYYSQSGINRNSTIRTRGPKSELVKSLQNSGEIVGYLSIGLPSDIQALRTAHVGIVMDQKLKFRKDTRLGYPTKEALAAADIFIPDAIKSFELILEQGRRIYADKDFIFQFRLPALFVLVLAYFISQIINMEMGSALHLHQILWICILTAALAFSQMYSNGQDAKNDKNYKLSMSTQLFPRHLLKNMIIQILYQSFVVVIAFIMVHGLAFHALAWMTLFNSINSRKIHEERNLLAGLSLRNPFLWTWFLCAICQVVIGIYGKHLFITQPSSYIDWILCIGLGFGSLIFYQISITIPIWKCTAADACVENNSNMQKQRKETCV